MADRITNPSDTSTPKENSKISKDKDTDLNNTEDPKIKEETVKDEGDTGSNNSDQVSALQATVNELTKKLETLMANFKPDATGKFEFKSNADETDVKRFESKEERTAKYINSQPKISIFVPLEGKETLGKASLPVTVNGHRWNVPKGSYVSVPEPIAKIVMDSLNQTEQAYDNAFRLDKDATGSARDEALH